MFEMAGLAALSTQFEIYRWEDHFREMRQLDYDAKMNAVFQEQYINRYNALVQKFNKLLSDAERYEGEVKCLLIERDRSIAQLEQEMAELRAAKAESDEKVRKYSLELARRVMSDHK